MPIWRRDEKGRSFALIMTKLSRVAVTAHNNRQPAHAASNASVAAARRARRVCGFGIALPYHIAIAIAVPPA